MSVRNYFSEANLNPTDWIEVSDDFTAEGASNVPDTFKWDVIKDSSAAVTVEADKNAGIMLMSSAATTEDDGSLVQSLNEFWLPTSGKRFALEVKIKGADADQQDIFVGMAQRAATNPENTLTASNRCGFQVNDGNASILLKSEASDIETSKDSEQDLADDTYVVLGMCYNGSGKLSFYVNQSPVGSIESNIPATELAIALFQLSGNATGTHTARVDYVKAVVER